MTNYFSANSLTGRVELDFQGSRALHKKLGIVDTDHNTARGYFENGDAVWWMTNRHDVRLTSGHVLGNFPGGPEWPVLACCEGEMRNNVDVNINFGMTIINIRVHGFSHLRPKGTVQVRSGGQVLVNDVMDSRYPPTGPGWGGPFEWVFKVGQVPFQLIMGVGYHSRIIRYWGWPGFSLRVYQKPEQSVELQ